MHLPPENMKITWIKFDDPISLEGWTSKEQAMKDLSDGYNEMVGWVLEETKKHITLTAHKDVTGEHYDFILKVPKSIIVEREEITICASKKSRKP